MATLSVHTTDELFTALPPREVRQLLSRTRGDADAKSEALRSLVGDRYGDLLGTADDAARLLDGVRSLTDRVEELRATTAQLIVDGNDSDAHDDLPEAESTVSPVAAARDLADWLAAAPDIAWQHIEGAGGPTGAGGLWAAACVASAASTACAIATTGSAVSSPAAIAVLPVTVTTMEHCAAIEAEAAAAAHAVASGNSALRWLPRRRDDAAAASRAQADLPSAAAGDGRGSGGESGEKDADDDVSLLVAALGALALFEAARATSTSLVDHRDGTHLGPRGRRQRLALALLDALPHVVATHAIAPASAALARCANAATGVGAAGGELGTAARAIAVVVRASAALLVPAPGSPTHLANYQLASLLPVALALQAGALHAAVAATVAFVAGGGRSDGAQQHQQSSTTNISWMTDPGLTLAPQWLANASGMGASSDADTGGVSPSVKEAASSPSAHGRYPILLPTSSLRPAHAAATQSSAPIALPASHGGATASLSVARRRLGDEFAAVSLSTSDGGRSDSDDAEALAATASTCVTEIRSASASWLRQTALPTVRALVATAIGGDAEQDGESTSSADGKDGPIPYSTLRRIVSQLRSECAWLDGDRDAVSSDVAFPAPSRSAPPPSFGSALAALQVGAVTGAGVYSYLYGASLRRVTLACFRRDLVSRLRAVATGAAHVAATVHASLATTDAAASLSQLVPPAQYGELLLQPPGDTNASQSGASAAVQGAGRDDGQTVSAPRSIASLLRVLRGGGVAGPAAVSATDERRAQRGAAYAEELVRHSAIGDLAAAGTEGERATAARIRAAVSRAVRAVAIHDADDDAVSVSRALTAEGPRDIDDPSMGTEGTDADPADDAMLLASSPILARMLQGAAASSSTAGSTTPLGAALCNSGAEIAAAIVACIEDFRAKSRAVRESHDGVVTGNDTLNEDEDLRFALCTARDHFVAVIQSAGDEYAAEAVTPAATSTSAVDVAAVPHHAGPDATAPSMGTSVGAAYASLHSAFINVSVAAALESMAPDGVVRKGHESAENMSLRADMTQTMRRSAVGWAAAWAVAIAYYCTEATAWHWRAETAWVIAACGAAHRGSGLTGHDGGAAGGGEIRQVTVAPIAASTASRAWRSSRGNWAIIDVHSGTVIKSSAGNAVASSEVGHQASTTGSPSTGVTGSRSDDADADAESSNGGGVTLALPTAPSPGLSACLTRLSLHGGRIVMPRRVAGGVDIDSTSAAGGDAWGAPSNSHAQHVVSPLHSGLDASYELCDMAQACLSAAARARLCQVYTSVRVTLVAVASQRSDSAKDVDSSGPSSLSGIVPDAPVLQAMLDIWVWGHLLPLTTAAPTPLSSALGTSPWSDLLSSTVPAVGQGSTRSPATASVPPSPIAFLALAAATRFVGSAPPLQAAASTTEGPSALWTGLGSLLDVVDRALAEPHVASAGADVLRANALCWAAAAPATVTNAPLVAGTAVICVARNAGAAEFGGGVGGVAEDGPSWRLADAQMLVSPTAAATAQQPRGDGSAAPAALLPAAIATASAAGTLAPRTLLLCTTLPAAVTTAELDAMSSPLLPLRPPSHVQRLPLLPIPIRGALLHLASAGTVTTSGSTAAGNVGTGASTGGALAAAAAGAFSSPVAAARFSSRLSAAAAAAGAAGRVGAASAAVTGGASQARAGGATGAGVGGAVAAGLSALGLPSSPSAASALLGLSSRLLGGASASGSSLLRAVGGGAGAVKSVSALAALTGDTAASDRVANHASYLDLVG